jgi:hypothetical protein
MPILFCRLGIVEGSWMVGIIDELRMPVDGISFHPSLVDTKTRFKATFPSEAQKRNGRLSFIIAFLTIKSRETVKLSHVLVLASNK